MSLILGLGGPYFHDSSAALITEDGTILAAAEEERFSRRKHNRDSRQCSSAAAFCLAHAGVSLRDVSEVVVAWNPMWPTLNEDSSDSELIREFIDPSYFRGYCPDRVTIVPHHLAHAASSFYLSGFEDAGVIVVDGSGDGVSTTTFKGSTEGLSATTEYPFTQSLGWFYESVAEHIGLGDWSSVGKLMGMAPYGTSRYDFPFANVTNDGYSIDLSMYGLASSRNYQDSYTNMQYYHELKRAYWRCFEDLGIAHQPRAHVYDIQSGRINTPEASHIQQQHADLAASAQEFLERSLLSLARTALRLADSVNLCIAGGVGLNCSANGVLNRESGAKELFIQPAAGDSGCALGCALEVARRRGTLSRKPTMNSVSLGPQFSNAEIDYVLRKFALDYKECSGEIASETAALLAGGAVVGWFQGRAEFGPRALGFRSILGNPMSVASRDRINRDIKGREMWRPLAPSILNRCANDYVMNLSNADFMIVAATATEQAVKDIPATVHVDGTVRPQFVSEAHQEYWELLNAFESLTGVGAVINTSFNSDSEPIVNTPGDAIRMFYSSPLDALAIGDFLLTK